MTAIIYTTVNQKGGVGKSTTALLFGTGLKHQGKRVLFVDADSQGNLTFSMGINAPAISTMSVITGVNTAQEAIQQTDFGDIIPASLALATADNAIPADAVDRNYRLREALAPLKDEYDYIIIDTPPALGVLSVNALTASDRVIIPTLADAFAVQGVARMFQTIAQVRQYTNKSLQVDGILLTRYNNRANLVKDITETIEKTAEQLGTKVYKTSIRECIAIREAQARRTDLFTYAPKSNAVQDYTALIQEITAS